MQTHLQQPTLSILSKVLPSPIMFVKQPTLPAFFIHRVPFPYLHTETLPHNKFPRACATPSSNNTSTELSEIANFKGPPSAARSLARRILNTITFPSLSDLKEGQIRDEPSTKLYTALQNAQILRAFASARPSTTSSRKRISAARLAAQAGLPLSALSPRRSTVLAWQVAGIAAVAAVVQLTRVIGMEQLARPAIFSLGLVFLADQVVLRGTGFETIYRALFPQYEEKVVKHEAGHFLAAYLHGLAVRGYVLSAAEAMRAGIPGQAGTLFSDDELSLELKRGKLSTRAIDRYSVVSMAGIAAEAINYGEAEGGQSDVTALLQLLTTLQPPWSEQDVRAQARWAVLEAILLLRRNEKAFVALCDAMRERKSLGDCVLVIEDNFSPPEAFEKDAKVLQENTTEDEERKLAEREKAILAELEKIQQKARHFDDK